MSLLAKKVALLQQREGEVAVLKQEIGEMLGLIEPKRSYTKRAGPLLQARLDADEHDDTSSRPAKKKFRPSNTTPPAEEAEILRRLKETDDLARNIAKAHDCTMSVISRIARGAGVDLRARGQRIKNARVAAGTGAPARQAPATATATNKNSLEEQAIAFRKAGKSQKEICRLVHKTNTWVRAVMKKHGMNGRITDEQRAQVLRLHAEGKLLKKEIADKVQLSKSAIHDIIARGK